MDFVYRKKRAKDTLFYLILIIAVIVGGYFIIYKQFISPPTYYFVPVREVSVFRKGELEKMIDELSNNSQFSQLREYTKSLPIRPSFKTFVEKFEIGQSVGRNNPFVNPSP